MNIRRTLGIAALVLFGLLVVGIGLLYAMFDGERVKKELVQVVKEQKQRTLSIAGELGLSVWPSLAITLGQASLSEPNSAQPFVSFERARVSLAVLPLLSRQVSVSAVELAGLKATVVKHKDGSFNFSDLLQSSTAQQAGKAPQASEPANAKGEPLRMDVAAIALSGAQLLWVDEKTGSRSTVSNLDISTGRIQADTASQTYLVNRVAIAARGKSGADTFDLRLDAPSIKVAADKATGDTVKMVAKLVGDKKNVQATLTLSGIQGSPQALNVAKVALDLDALAGEARVRGGIESPLLVNVQAQTVVLDKLSGKLEVAHPAMPMKQMTLLPIAGHVRADLAKSSADVALNTQLDESKVALQAGIAKFAPLALGFDLDIDQLNVDKYFAPAPAGSADAGGGVGGDVVGPRGADPKVDLSALKGLNVSGLLKVGALQVSSIKLAKLQAKLSALDGYLSIAPISANLYQGTLLGSLSASAVDNSLALKQTLSGISIGPLLKDVADKDMLEGRGTVVLDVQTDGATVGAMKKSLDGTASLSLKDGAIKGINLGKSFRELKAKWGGGGDSTQQPNSSDKTDFSELSANFKIADGVAHNDDLAIKSPFLRLGGAGDIDIGNSQLNYLAKASVVNTDAGQSGKELDQLKGLTIPVRLSGPFSSPSYKIEFGSLISDAAKAKVQAQVEEKKQEVKQKLEDVLKDKFKGLLGR